MRIGRKQSERGFSLIRIAACSGGRLGMVRRGRAFYGGGASASWLGCLDAHRDIGELGIRSGNVRTYRSASNRSAGDNPGQ